MSDHQCLINEKTSVEIEKAMSVQLILTFLRRYPFKNDYKINFLELYINVRFHKKCAFNERMTARVPLCSITYAFLMRDFDSELYISDKINNSKYL